MCRVIMLTVALCMLLLSGCAQQVQNPQQTEQEDDNSADILSEIVPTGNDSTQYEVDSNSAPKLALPLQCDDDILVSAIKTKIGANYEVGRGAATLGRNFSSVNCFVKLDNVSIITYYFQDTKDEETALFSLEDERKQYQEQIFRYTFEDSTVGLKGYVFDQPVEDGSLYRVIFVDDSYSKLLVILRSTRVLPKETVLSVAKAINETI